MDKILDSPWFLRFAALFLAILLFVTVQTEEQKLKQGMSGEDSDILRDVPVEVFYDNENLIVTGVPETVDVAIEGPINIVQSTTLLKDFSLLVDLRSLPMGEHQVRIQHENISEKLTVRLDPAVIDVKIEEKITQTFKVEPEFNRQLLAADFYVANMEVNPSTIEVTGAKSVVESISFVKATVSGEQGINKSFEQDARVRVLDRDLNKLDLIIEPETVKVKVDIQENSKEVPIVLNAKGTPPEGVAIKSLSADAEKITLSGPSSVLDKIEILSVDVDVSKIKESGTVDIELNTPKDISKMSSTKIKVTVDATTASDADADEEAEEADVTMDEPEVEVPDPAPDEQVTVETVKFERVQVAVIGLDRQFKGTLVRPNNGLVTLTVTAPPDIIGGLAESDFDVSIDASGATAVGEATYPIIVKGPTNVRWTISEEEAMLSVEIA